MASGDFAPVLAALSVMSSSAERDQNSQAHDFLGKFQKSVCSIAESSANVVIDPSRSKKPGTRHTPSWQTRKPIPRRSSLQPLH